MVCGFDFLRKNLYIDGISRWWRIIPNYSRGLDTNFVSVTFWGHLLTPRMFRVDILDIRGLRWLNRFEWNHFVDSFGYVLYCWDEEVIMECFVWDMEGSFGYLSKAFILECLDFIFIRSFGRTPKLYIIWPY